jgi:hypothetical protein
MPITVSCPSCNTTLRAPNNAAGRKVKCPKCATPFDVPAAGAAPVMAVAPVPPSRPAPPPPREDYEDYEEEPAPRRRHASADSSAVGLQSGLGIASMCVGIIGLVFAFIPCMIWFSLPLSGVGLVLGVVGLIVALTRDKQGLGFPIAGSSVSGAAILISVIWLFLIAHAFSTATTAVTDLQKKMLEQLEKMPKLKIDNNPVGGGAKILDENGQLAAADPFDKVRQGSKAKSHSVKMTAGKTYQIDMTSGEVDSFLRLENPGGQQVAEDDDGGGFPNARIIYNCAQSGNYRIICTTFIGGTGNYHLTVQER